MNNIHVRIDQEKADKLKKIIQGKGFKNKSEGIKFCIDFTSKYWFVEKILDKQNKGE